ncbi:MAG: OmpH family outer membrane protein [bacterium]|jgi:Skp family chaperone for outer membrane proteins|nr:OmpH family outer membrane protein [bacterium]MBK7045909.1 OmpH family outer membrane protein [bacterium]MBK7671541.1 OmpH family outer membrane protein [bacterium]MBK7770597.1 OmpH family outer membrane protein [bacterium]MBK9473448.1 OmpH family outer membrane protein [bacterium]
MKRTKMTRLALVAGFLLAATVAQAADPRPLAIIDSQRIAEEYEAARDAQEQYQKFIKELEREVADKEKALTALMEEIDSQKLLLGQEALATKTQQFERQRAEYFQFRETIDQRAEAEYKTRIQPILDQVKTIVERLGKERNYGLILDSAAVSVLYVNPEFDLTNDVLQALVRGDK